MIEVKDLKKIYKTKKGVVVKALDGVSLKLPEVGMVFILGKSGSGKSTLLNVIGGLDSIDSGEIIIKGSSCRDFKQSHYDSYRNTYVGFIFQEYNILEELTVGANIALAIELQGRKATNEEVSSILEEVDLAGYGSRKPNELSGGQKQRVAIARALVKKPEIIMADEPTGALDSATGRQVFDTLKKLSRDKLVLIVSHDREFSEQYADRIIELSDGKVISDVEKCSHDEISEDNEPQDEPISFCEDEIAIKPGYYITEEDRVKINEYLKNLSGGGKIKLSEKRGKRVSSAEFKPTDESRIVQKGGEFRLIKSKLSLKNAFKIGSGALKYKKIRLVFTIFLSLIAFTLFGLSDTIAAYDSIGTTTNSLIDSAVNYASFSKDVKFRYGDGANDYYWDSSDTYLSPEDIRIIEEKTGLGIIGIFRDENLNLSLNANIGRPEDKPKLQMIYSESLSGITSIDQDFISEHGFTLEGALPSEKGEIVITRFMYECFEAYGYLDNGTGETVKIDEEKDLIGKTLLFTKGLPKLKISGILDTGFDYTRYLPLADDNAASAMNPLVYMALISELESAKGYSYACLGFVHEDMINELAEKKAASAELFRGELALYKGTLAEGEYFYDKPNATLQYISSFSDVKNNVVWAGEELSELRDDQIILSPSSLIAILGSVGEDALYDQDILVGFERTLLKSGMIYQLYDVIYQLDWCAAARYAYNNYDKAVKILSEKNYGDYFGSTEELMRTFADCSRGDPSILTDSGLENLTEEYLSDLVATYELSHMLIPSAALNDLVASRVINGTRYYSTYEDTLLSARLLPIMQGEFSSIIARKYAMENYEDALRYVSMMDKTNSSLYSVDDVCLSYSYYLIGAKDNTVLDFKPSDTAENFADYYARHTLSFYKSVSNSSEPLNIEWRSYMTNDSGTIENVEIVALISNTENSYEAPLAFSDAMIKRILGPDRGGLYSFAIANMPEAESDVRDVVKFTKTEFEDSYRFTLKNSVTQELSFVEEILVVLGSVFLYVGIAFAVFAALMLSNFIGTSISYKKQDIGILRAIGSRSNDVFRIFFAESFIIAMINFVLASVMTGVASALVNSILRDSVGLLITFLSFGIRQIAILFAVSLLVAFVATFLPVRKIAKKKPIDAIKNRK